MAEPEVKNVFSMGGPTLASYTSNGDKLIVAGVNGVARIYTVGQDEKEPETIDILEEASDLAINTSGSIFAVSSKSGEVELYSATSFKPHGKVIRSALPIRGVTFTHGDTMVAAAGDDDEVQITEIADTEHIIKFKAGDQVHDISYNNKKDFAALSLSNGEIKIYSISSEEPQIVTSIKDETLALIYQDYDEEAEDNLASARVEWHPEGDLFAVPCQNKAIKIFSVSEDFSAVSTLSRRFDSAIADLKWSPKGEYIVAVDISNRLIVFDRASREAIVDEKLPTKVFNLSWAPGKDGKYNLACGSENGDMIIFKGIAESKSQSNGSAAPVTDLMADDGDIDDNVEDDLGLRDNDDIGLKDAEDEEGDADDINAMSDVSNDDDAGDDLRDFVDDDEDGLGDGYTIPQKRRTAPETEDDSRDLRDRKHSRPLQTTHPDTGYDIKPYSPGCTPYISDRRYLTINSIGYVSSVRQTAHYSITVSFFDQSIHREYHFDDVYGFDLAALTSTGILLGCSGKGSQSARIYFRPHQNNNESWQRTIPTRGKEILSSISLSDTVAIACTSLGYIRNFSLFGIPTGIQKSSPVIACATNSNYIFTVSASNRQLVYNLQDLDGRFLQRDLMLPHELSSGIDLFRGIFFSTYGDPIVVGDDGVVLVLSRWRSPLQARWVPLLDSDSRIKEIGGKGDLKVWPLGLHGDNLNCIILRGAKYPVYPLPLPSELEVRIPLGGEVEEGAEDPEEELVRAKTMGELLGETLSNEGETFEDDEERLNGYAISHDRAVLKLFVQACSDDKSAKAWKLAQDLQQDKALVAAVKVADRVGLVALVNRINSLRDQRMEQELASQTQS